MAGLAQQNAYPSLQGFDFVLSPHTFWQRLIMTGVRQVKNWGKKKRNKPLLLEALSGLGGESPSK